MCKIWIFQLKLAESYLITLRSHEVNVLYKKGCIHNSGFKHLKDKLSLFRIYSNVLK